MNKNICGFKDEALIIQDTGKIVKGRPVYILLRPLKFTYQINGGGLEIEIPQGFETDFASIPRIFWPILPPTGRYSKAAVLHDYLYGLPNCSRFLADAMLREAMYQLDVPLWKRIVVFYFVRTFGWIFKTGFKP